MESGNETTDIDASYESLQRSQSELVGGTEEDGNTSVKGEKAETYPRTGNNIQREPSVKSKSVVKQGHLRIKEDGQKVYKKTPSQAIMLATQLGIGFSVGRLSAKPERDVLMQDFYFVEKVWFPAEGSKETPSHKFNDFRFKTYAPAAFRYFRDLFEIRPSDFLISLSNETLKEIGNPGASGSLFFVSNDDMFIVKTVQHKEATFLQQLLSGYYMNLHQNPRTLLPKFFGLYCYQAGTSNIRLTVMNNLLPSKYKCHYKFDLKGSTYKRKASKGEKAKASPTYKDLDFLQMFPKGITLDHETYDVVIKTISRDVRVLESFSIMDYSFLLGVHNIDQRIRERGMSSPKAKSKNPEREARKNEFSAALEAIQLSKDEDEEERPVGCIPAKNAKGERVYLFIGIIDILQSYRLAKKMEHGFKSMFTDGDTVSVHKPSFYAKRFLDFIKDHVFTRSSVQRVPTKKRSGKTEVKMERQVTNEEITSRALNDSAQGTSADDGEGQTRAKTKSVTIVEPDVDDSKVIDDNDSKVIDNNDTSAGSSSAADPNDINVTIVKTTTEGEMTTTVGDITTTEGDITTTEADITTTERDITTTEGDVTTTEGDVTTTEGDVTTTEGDITITEGAVTTTEGEFTITETVVTKTDSSNSDIATTTEETAPQKGFGAITITVDNKDGVASVVKESSTVEMNTISTTVETATTIEQSDDSHL